MEPTGVMDNKRGQLQVDDDDALGSDFTVCDLGDEEVHFSRHSSDYYFYQHSGERKFSSASSHHEQPNQHVQQARTQATGSGHQHGGAPLASYNKLARKASTLSSLDANHFADHSYQHPNSHQYNHISGEQISSGRLLNNIGNKLRRGSSYLNAPTKLLGQYLLGITIQSWSEFFNTSRMMKVPGTRHQLTRRLCTNLSYFQGNYLCVSLILVIYCILTSPLLLIAIAVYLLTLYLVTARSALGKQTKIFGFRLNLQQQYSFITMLSLPFLWIAGAPSAVFWVIGASFFVVGLHASMFANEQSVAEQHLASSSRAHQSLAAHTPMHFINQQSTAIAHRQATSLTSAQSAVQYYNHYPGIAKSGAQGYIPVTQVAPTKVATSVSASSVRGGYMPSAISQWITLGLRRSSSSGHVVSLTTGSNEQQENKAPEVKIISRDYAGLGRVYEV